MINHNGAWLPSVTIGVPVLAVLALIILALVVVVVFFARGDQSDLWMIGWIPVVVFLALVIGPAFGYWPWHADYHKLQPVTGTVQAIDTRFMAASQFGSPEGADGWGCRWGEQ